MSLHESAIDNSSALVLVMDRRRTCYKPLPLTMMAQFTDAYMGYHGTLKLDGVYYFLNSVPRCHTATKKYACHDSTSVALWAKCRSDRLIQIWRRANCNFIEFNYDTKIVSEMFQV